MIVPTTSATKSNLTNFKLNTYIFISFFDRKTNWINISKVNEFPLNQFFDYKNENFPKKSEQAKEKDEEKNVRKKKMLKKSFSSK